MMDCDKLVKALRHCVSDEKGVTKCAGCPYYPDITGCMDRLHTDAAAAIEELQSILTEADKKQAYQHDYICELVAEKEELQAETERLQAQLPKRGEWIGVSPFVDSEQCSICGYCIHSEELETPYCPWCGAKMEVQDDKTGV